MKTTKNFPNGFTSWAETHYEMVSMITIMYEKGSEELEAYLENRGIGGFYELSAELTDKFEEENEGRSWDGEFFEEIEFFFDNEIKKLCQQ